MSMPSRCETLTSTQWTCVEERREWRENRMKERRARETEKGRMRARKAILKRITTQRKCVLIVVDHLHCNAWVEKLACNIRISPTFSQTAQPVWQHSFFIPSLITLFKNMLANCRLDWWYHYWKLCYIMGYHFFQSHPEKDVWGILD